MTLAEFIAIMDEMVAYDSLPSERARRRARWALSTYLFGQWKEVIRPALVKELP